MPSEQTYLVVVEADDDVWVFAVQNMGLVTVVPSGQTYVDDWTSIQPKDTRNNTKINEINIFFIYSPKIRLLFTFLNTTSEIFSRFQSMNRLQGVFFLPRTGAMLFLKDLHNQSWTNQDQIFQLQ